MKAGFLSEYFKGVVVKRLVPGEIDGEGLLIITDYGSDTVGVMP